MLPFILIAVGFLIGMVFPPLGGIIIIIGIFMMWGLL